MKMNDGIIDKFRFQIIDDQGRARSSSWFVNHHGDDLYLAPRSTGFALKLSLHSDGNCQYGTTAGYLKHAAAQGVRDLPPLIRWKRAETPETGGVAVASILFPTDFLNRIGVPLDSALKFKWAPPGDAIEMILVYSRDAPSASEAGLLSKGIAPIAYVHLNGGEYVSIGTRRVKVDPLFIPDLGKQSEQFRPLTGAPKPGERLGAAHAIMVLKHPADGEPIHLLEINGISVSRAG